MAKKVKYNNLQDNFCVWKQGNTAAESCLDWQSSWENSAVCEKLLLITDTFNLNRYSLNNITQFRKGNINMHKPNFYVDRSDNITLIYIDTRTNHENP